MTPLERMVKQELDCYQGIDPIRQLLAESFIKLLCREQARVRRLVKNMEGIYGAMPGGPYLSQQKLLAALKEKNL